MPQIRPISDLRNNFAEISRIVHDNKDPIFLTKNGYGDMVVMSMELYEELGIAAMLIEHKPEAAAKPEHPEHPTRPTTREESETELKIQKPLSMWQKTLSNFGSKQ